MRTPLLTLALAAFAAAPLAATAAPTKGDKPPREKRGDTVADRHEDAKEDAAAEGWVKPPVDEQAVTTRHEVATRSGRIHYTATAGTLTIRDDDAKPTASVFYVAYTADTIDVSLAGLCGCAFFMYGGFGPYASLVLDLAPERERGAFVGFVNTGGQLGGILAPLVVGWVVHLTGSFDGGFAFMIAALTASASCYAGIAYVSARPSAPPLLPVSHPVGRS